MLPSARPARRAITGAIGTGAITGAMLFGAAATATAQPLPEPPVPPPCTAAETGARHVRRHVRHVELPNPPPQRERLLHQPQRPTQGSDQRSGADLSRRQSGGSGRASDHPATLGRLSPTLWGSRDPLTASAARGLWCKVVRSWAVLARDAVRFKAVRSLTNSRSYSASDPRTPIIIRPAAVEESMRSEGDTRVTPISVRALTVSRMWSMLRPSRSSFHTTTVSPARS